MAVGKVLAAGTGAEEEKPGGTEADIERMVLEDLEQVRGSEGLTGPIDRLD